VRIGHQNRNREVLQEVMQALTPEVKRDERRTRIIDNTNAIQNSEEYRTLASYGKQTSTFEGGCHGCIVSKWCSACVLVGWIVTPKQCKEARKVATEAVLKKVLSEVEFKVR